MPWCPVCKNEYREGIAHCVDCNVALVESLDEEIGDVGDAQQKQENQVKAIRDFILQKVDYIVLDAIAETGWDAVLAEAKQAGIPVILSDRSVRVEDDSLYTSWIGSDFCRQGERAGIWLRDYLEEKGRAEEPINLVTLQGTLDSTAQLGRTEGFAKILEKQDNWTMLEQRTGEFVQAKAREVMEYFLETYPDIDVVICQNDNMAFGAIEAMKEQGKSYGKYGDIIVISFDAAEAALEAVRKGEINADFECCPDLGPLVDETIKKLEAGEEVEKSSTWKKPIMIKGNTYGQGRQRNCLTGGKTCYRQRIINFGFVPGLRTCMGMHAWKK